MNYPPATYASFRFMWHVLKKKGHLITPICDTCFNKNFAVELDCSCCGYKFSILDDLMEHEELCRKHQIHGLQHKQITKQKRDKFEKMLNRCTPCNIIFSNRIQIRNHRIQQHPKSQESKQPNTSQQSNTTQSPSTSQPPTSTQVQKSVAPSQGK